MFDLPTLQAVMIERPPLRVFSPGEQRRILLEHTFFLRADELCTKWGITRNLLRKWKREVGWTYFFPDFRETAIAALYSASASGSTLDAILEYTDWVQHTRLRDDEMLEILRSLERDGIAVRDGELWRYDRGHLDDGGHIF